MSVCPSVLGKVRYLPLVSGLDMISFTTSQIRRRHAWRTRPHLMEITLVNFRKNKTGKDEVNGQAVEQNKKKGVRSTTQDFPTTSRHRAATATRGRLALPYLDVKMLQLVFRGVCAADDNRETPPGAA
ncbi:hypothetical protein RRG08_017471 [Elysia crispata]|uniref:Uncharacterized protein n=1 Tax=Elysia crispata TaxID=231223 RepID=A0AAE0YI57_9GAST|nr:hypothetical protein RRG08_017471 [Elysia crispata]